MQRRHMPRVLPAGTPRPPSTRASLLLSDSTMPRWLSVPGDSEHRLKRGRMVGNQYHRHWLPRCRRSPRRVRLGDRSRGCLRQQSTKPFVRGSSSTVQVRAPARAQHSFTFSWRAADASTSNVRRLSRAGFPTRPSADKSLRRLYRAGAVTFARSQYRDFIGFRVLQTRAETADWWLGQNRFVPLNSRSQHAVGSTIGSFFADDNGGHQRRIEELIAVRFSRLPARSQHLPPAVVHSAKRDCCVSRLDDQRRVEPEQQQRRLAG